MATALEDDWAGSFSAMIFFAVIGLIPSPIALAENSLQGPQPLQSNSNDISESESQTLMIQADPNQRALHLRGCPRRTTNDQPTQTIERVSGEERGPRIAEPMVFDLIRPLGAKRGEGEVNVLGLVPLRQESSRMNQIQDPLGLVRRSPDREIIEWAPEIEYAICDGMAIEFEVPLENNHVEAYKGATQITFGTALNHRFIHGAQGILQYGRDSGVWSATGLYLAGFRFNNTWSMFGMIGGRGEIVGPVPSKEVEVLVNGTLFADLTDRLVAGIETNWDQVINGNTGVLIMPQLHYEIDRMWMIQAGAGARVTTSRTMPVVGFRIIREF